MRYRREPCAGPLQPTQTCSECIRLITSRAKERKRSLTFDPILFSCDGLFIMTHATIASIDPSAGTVPANLLLDAHNR